MKFTLYNYIDYSLALDYVNTRTRNFLKLKKLLTSFRVEHIKDKSACVWQSKILEFGN